jgi:hypothetical protein
LFHTRDIRRPVRFVTFYFLSSDQKLFLAADQKQCYQRWNFEPEVDEGPADPRTGFGGTRSFVQAE